LAEDAEPVILLEPHREVGGRQRSAPVVALAHVAANTEEKRQAVVRLHALGHHPLIEPVNQIDDAPSLSATGGSTANRQRLHSPRGDERRSGWSRRCGRSLMSE
jgi:hypothetical protein